ncbi:hypothetical protein IHE77_24805 (plasmid) [Serratia ureilytica]|uniref:hypothetical protein n=2 Tax=Serratia ureilytica TaxID=300181 RepID=UPI001F4D342D|nr:hypothetical protein [Serratia ureilytica]UNE46532.1 hypothetical protein IHE77_24805 [Serratia ureilytica]
MIKLYMHTVVIIIMKDGYNPFQTTGINFFRHCDEMIQVVYLGAFLERIEPGALIFFQRLDGLFWMGRVWPELFWFELEKPITVMEGLTFLSQQHYMRILHEKEGDFVHQHELPF